MTRLLLLLAVTLTLAGQAHAHHGHKPGPRLAKEIRRHFPQAEWHRASCIAWHESRFREKAINWRDWHANGPGSFGAFQLARIWIVYTGGSWQRLLTYRTNVRVARIVWERAGRSWRPWAASRYC